MTIAGIAHGASRRMASTAVDTRSRRATEDVAIGAALRPQSALTQARAQVLRTWPDAYRRRGSLHLGGQDQAVRVISRGVIRFPRAKPLIRTVLYNFATPTPNSTRRKVDVGLPCRSVRWLAV